MRRNTVRYILLVQVVSFIGTIACIIIKPHGLVANSGLSYFGNFKATIVPYAVVLLGGSWFFYKAAASLPEEGYNLTKRALTVFAILYIGLFFTPYTLNNVFDWLHTLFGITLFSYQLLLTGWIVTKSGLDRFLALIWLLEFGAGVLCAIYTPPPTGYLLECQIVFQLVFTIFYAKYLSMEKATHKLTEVRFTPYLIRK